MSALVDRWVSALIDAPTWDRLDQKTADIFRVEVLQGARPEALHRVASASEARRREFTALTPIKEAVMAERRAAREAGGSR